MSSSKRTSSTFDKSTKGPLTVPFTITALFPFAIATFCFTLSLLAANLGRANAQSAQIDFDWSSVLARHDMVWERLPQKWKESPFVGNGEQGSMIYQWRDNVLKWSIGCSAAHDHRPHAQDDLAEKNVPVLNRGRHFIGHLELRCKNKILGGTSRLNLWDAEVTGTLDTGSVFNWRTLAHANEPVTFIEIVGAESLEDFEFAYVPALARSPRAVRAKLPRNPPNPKPEEAQAEDDIRTVVQNLHAGGQTAVAWKVVRNDGTLKLWISVKHSFPERSALQSVVSAVKSAAAADGERWLANHRRWWHQYYRQSYLATGDAYWDSFYWAQQYKLACATRDKGWILDNQGPWLQPTAWNSLWWNLNVQIAHSGFATANRRGMGSALSHQLDIKRDNLALNVVPKYRHDSYAIGRNTSGWDLLGHAGQPGTGRPPMDRSIGRETGNLLWALHNVDLEVRYWQDERLRDEVLYPLLVRAVNYYLHFLEPGADGLLHLPATHSPELRNVADCSYDLDLLRWAVGRLIELAETQGITSQQQPLVETWRRVQKTLVPTYRDAETGIMVGRDMPLKGPHRHWSHLISIYPLMTLTPEAPSDRALIRRSLDHWHSFKRRGMGYSVTGGCCMASILEDSGRAYQFLQRLRGFLLPNTFYVENGTLPVIETPLHGATAIQDMLLQSWGGRIRVFPAVAKVWANAQFHNLRCDGAFLVSAARRQDQTHWVTVFSEVGGSVEVAPGINAAQWLASEGVEVSKRGDGIYNVTFPAGGRVSFWAKGQQQPDFKISGFDDDEETYRFGLRK